ncbi:MAG TPA: TIGR03088 family PEP-CTERM/XrtA system glycosyltransferase [Burkholderiaceae bacterium]|nr:TIGR03088 family PEP-CTERM/XrtA system glycosyltransferase [Burkholderiaceae bacterium]
MSARDARLLVAHVVYRFDVGGLENGVVNLLNRLPSERFRHAVIALTEVTDFRRRVQRDDVQYFALDKRPGHGAKLWPALHRVFRALRPDVVHTRNLAPLEACVPAWLAGVPVRVHGEHGWDVGDLDGSNRRHRTTRRLYRPFVTHYIALSRHIEDYLWQQIGIPSARISQIYNGVDMQRFAAPAMTRAPIEGSPFNDPRLWLCGTVGRLAAVKDQAALVRTLARLQRIHAEARSRMRLAMVGDGPLAAELRELARSEGVADSVWLPGARGDIAQIMGGLDAFALPSLSEGISNTLLEAMASARPCVATAVGGNVELIEGGTSGTLVPAADPQRLDAALHGYFADPAAARHHGVAARAAVEQRFSLERMVSDYAALYERLVPRDARRAAAVKDAVFETRAGH